MPQLSINVGRRVFDFDTWNDWVANAHRRIAASGAIPSGTAWTSELLFVDGRGQVIISAAHFRDAQYPVVAYSIQPEE